MRINISSFWFFLNKNSQNSHSHCDCFQKQSQLRSQYSFAQLVDSSTPYIGQNLGDFSIAFWIYGETHLYIKYISCWPKCDIKTKLGNCRFYSHLLKKSLMKNLIFYAVRFEDVWILDFGRIRYSVLHFRLGIIHLVHTVKFSEKLREVFYSLMQNFKLKNVSFSEHFAYVLTCWFSISPLPY